MAKTVVILIFCWPRTKETIRFVQYIPVSREEDASTKTRNCNGVYVKENEVVINKVRAYRT